MHFLKLLASLVVVPIVSAQSTLLQFTGETVDLSLGKTIDIHYVAPSEDLPVTILLRKGDGSDSTVATTLTSSATGGLFTWTVPDFLDPGTDYCFEIQQGQESCESEGFSINALIDSPVLPEVLGKVSRISGAPIPIRPRTIESSAAPMMTAAPTRRILLPNRAASMGTGSQIPRNTTFVSPTLKPTTEPITTAQVPPPTSTPVTTPQTPSPGAASSTNLAYTSVLAVALCLMVCLA